MTDGQRLDLLTRYMQSGMGFDDALEHVADAAAPDVAERAAAIVLTALRDAFKQYDAPTEP